MPLLPGADPKAEVTSEAQEQAEKMGAALIKALFGDRFGKNPKFQGIKEGLQDFNGFVVDDTGNKAAVLSFLRFGQGEIQDENHILQNLGNINKLADGGLPTPHFLKGKDEKLLMTVPTQVEIDGNMVDVPRDVQGGAWAVAQEFIPAKTVPNPIQTLEQAREMGRLHGKYFAVGEEVFDDIGEMRNPVSPRALEQMIQRGLGQDDSVSLADNLAALGRADEKEVSAMLKMKADFEQKIASELEILAEMKPSDEKTRREKSMALVQEIVDLMEEQDWGYKTLKDYKEARDTWKREGFDELPTARNQGDFHSGNYFAPDENHSIGVMFDMLGWMGDGTRLFDMSQALAISCHKDGKFWPEAAKAYVDGVQEELKLTEAELEAFPKMLDITYLRSIATRFTSVVASPETQFVTKSPVELQGRRGGYQKDILATGKNWARGEFPEVTPSSTVTDPEGPGKGGPAR